MWGSHAARWATSDTGGPETDSSSDDGRLPLIPVAAQGGDVVGLGEFHRGTGGWRGGDLVSVERIREPARPGAVSSDSAALRFDIDGATAAAITNKQRARDADWVGHPYLTATVTPSNLAGTDAPVYAFFRLVHDGHNAGKGRYSGSPTPRTRAHTGRGRASRPRDASLTSETFSVPQGQPVRLYWDLSDVDERIRDSVVRLELVCERADQPSSEGPHGRNGGIRGSITLDDVALSDSPDVIAAAKLQTHWQGLLAKYGDHVETVPEVKKTSVESGRFIFDDGDIEYGFEIGDDGTHVFTLGSTAYRFEDGMAATERR